jgi:DNA-binding PadR family transcriptional regulator
VITARRESAKPEVEDSSSLLTDFSRFYILLLLFEGQKHGYQLMSAVQERLGQSISPSLVYPFLKLLEKQGLVKHESKNVGQKVKKVYSLTKDGRGLCGKLFKQFTMIVSTAIEPSMQVCAHCGCRVYKDAYFETVNGKKTAFCCVYCARAFKSER